MNDYADNYPEHEKQHKIKDFSQKCGEFVDWLQKEKGLVLAVYGKRVTNADKLYPADPSIPQLLAEFFKVDPQKLEVEKREMLEAMRAAYISREKEGTP